MLSACSALIDGQFVLSSLLCCKEIGAPGKKSMNWVANSCALCHKKSQKIEGRFLLSLWIPKVDRDQNRWILFRNLRIQL